MVTSLVRGLLGGVLLSAADGDTSLPPPSAVTLFTLSNFILGIHPCSLIDTTPMCLQMRPYRAPRQVHALSPFRTISSETVPSSDIDDATYLNPCTSTQTRTPSLLPRTSPLHPLTFFHNSRNVNSVPDVSGHHGGVLLSRCSSLWKVCRFLCTHKTLHYRTRYCH